MTTTATLIGTTSAVSLRGVTRVYGRGPDAVRAVDDVHLDFPRGGWTAVMGPSGSGKSTLLHCAAGLERVDAGRVLLGDTDITAARDAELTALRRTRIGFVFQSFNLIGSLRPGTVAAGPGGGRVQRAGRLVGEQHVRPGHHGPGRSPPAAAGRRRVPAACAGPGRRGRPR